jgi:pimeloyl-ACP methyl ester carboxylesterase
VSRVFGLVHGAYQGAWCWEPLMAELGRLGHRAVAVDLPCEDPRAGAEQYAEVAVRRFAGLPDDLVLVGHSLAGLSIPLVARQRSVSRLVFLNALIPRPGAAHDEAARAEPHMLRPRPAGGFAQDASGLTRVVTTEAVERWLFADCPPEVASWAGARIRGQCWKVTAEVTPLEAWPDVPRTSLVGAEDRVVDPDWSIGAARDLLGVAPVVVDQGHSPFLSAPGRFAATLLELP